MILKNGKNQSLILSPILTTGMILTIGVILRNSVIEVRALINWISVYPVDGFW